MAIAKGASGDGVHCGRYNRDVKLDFPGQAGSRVGFRRHNLRPSRLQQDVVECQIFLERTITWCNGHGANLLVSAKPAVGLPVQTSWDSNKASDSTVGGCVYHHPKRKAKRHSQVFIGFRTSIAKPGRQHVKF